MAAAPTFPATGNVSSVLVTAANTSSAGGGTIGTDIFKAFTAGAAGAKVPRARWIPVATAPTGTTATVGRIFICTTGSGAVTSATCWLVAEVSLPAFGADSATVPCYPIDTPLDIARLPAGYTILCTNHAAPAANSNWRLVVDGEDY